MDGVVANNTPSSHAAALGASTACVLPTGQSRCAYVLPTGHACGLTQPLSPLGTALHALSPVTHSHLVADIEHHRDRVKLVVLPDAVPADDPSGRLRRADDLISPWLSDAPR
jgi:NTE family protein